MKNTPFRLVYIRHADKEYVNGNSPIYKHDPGITTKGVEKTKKVANHLIEKWGIPERIVVSPYRRTRETGIVMNKIIENKKTPINVDNDLSEYLGNHRFVTIDVTDETIYHDPPHPESFLDMKIRVKRHHKNMVEYSKNKKCGVVWLITHGLIIKQIASLYDVQMPNAFPSLTCLSIPNGNSIINGEIITFD